MRSPLKSVTKRIRDAESELNLPPGFRFHPTDEELIVHYLCRKSQSTAETVDVAPPPPIIADVDLYKHEPWELPEMALFGTKEWYFFTPRDRKYPNGSRPNRVTGNGYWKATGADKPIKRKSDPNSIVGIKKALVFYAGKGTKGIKTNWIMHEYRLNSTPSKHTKNISKLDDWVLCRLYNKKNNPNEKMIPEDNNIDHSRDLHPTSPLDESERGNSCSNNSDSLNTFEDSDGEFGGNFEGDVMFISDLPREVLTKVKGTSEQSSIDLVENLIQDGNEWLDSISLEDMHHFLESMPPNHDIYEMPLIYNQDFDYLIHGV
ncbi:hypothetical protein L2E82_04928 [Cichorium intybus]|uniref:Uncharacterized protein n=1 Tax=Cichorium intybus TaxID=13427 RepID=A0ACB9H8E3_CICIN|nr:hypothetical protein L2E82_04928 [Cichorium intybus]